MFRRSCRESGLKEGKEEKERIIQNSRGDVRGGDTRKRERKPSGDQERKKTVFNRKGQKRGE